MRRMFDAFISLKVTLWMLGALLMLMVVGAVMMPARPEAYAGMSGGALLRWLVSTRPADGWWIWASMAVLGALALQTLACSADSLVRKRGGRHWLLVISPQIIHFGFLFMLAAHLVSGLGGYKGSGVLAEGDAVSLPTGETLRVDRVLVTSQGGFPMDWRAELSYLDQSGRELAHDTSAPNAPSIRHGYGLYIKQAAERQGMFELTREPGAPWAMAGGSLFTLGTLMLIGLKVLRGR